jgi:flavin-dependent dehydrogenase
METRESFFDVVIVGGGVAGSSTALLLKRRLPAARILIVEKSESFDRKVGESTVEISSYFFIRVLKLYDYFSRRQLPKQGFRYWFSNARATTLKTASEVGPKQLARLPSFQLDRQSLDEDLLALAEKEGVEVWRPATVSELEIPENGAPNRLMVSVEGETRRISCRWAVDASGRATLFARKFGERRFNSDHPTSAIWARFENVRDMDGVDTSGTDPEDPWFRAVPVARRLATNHFTGYGYWWWFIPLKNGETSVGIVWDKRFLTPIDGDLTCRFRDLAGRNPLVTEMLAGARMVDRDIRTLGHLPYFVDRCCGRGWAAVGDAAGFLDPFYSPGLDHLAFSASDRVALIEKDLAGGGVTKGEIEESNRAFSQFFQFFFEAIYRDKYVYMGDYDLMTAAFLLDTGLYYRVAVWPAYKKSSSTLRRPPFSDRRGKIGLVPLRFYNRRFVSIARRRLELGTYGKRNDGRRPALVGFSLGAANNAMIARGLAMWARAEVENLLSYARLPRRARAARVGGRMRVVRALRQDFRDFLTLLSTPPHRVVWDFLTGNFGPRRLRPRFQIRYRRLAAASRGNLLRNA